MPQHPVPQQQLGPGQGGPGGVRMGGPNQPQMMSSMGQQNMQMVRVRVCDSCFHAWLNNFSNRLPLASNPAGNGPSGSGRPGEPTPAATARQPRDARSQPDDGQHARQAHGHEPGTVTVSQTFITLFTHITDLKA